jgi:hypothetical protein
MRVDHEQLSKRLLELCAQFLGGLLILRQITTPLRTTSRFIPPPPPPHTQTQALLRQAWACWREAQAAVNKQVDDMEAWDPSVQFANGAEVQRKELMAATQRPKLNRAREFAEHALALARTRDETCQAILVLWRIEVDAGHVQEELKYARCLVALKPHSDRAVQALHDAMKDNGLALRAPNRTAQPGSSAAPSLAEELATRGFC